jgi:hypothetical protein
MYGTMNILNKIRSDHVASTICEAYKEIFIGSGNKVLDHIRINKDENLVNDILLSKDIVTATNYILEMNSQNNETWDGF